MWAAKLVVICSSSYRKLTQSHGLQGSHNSNPSWYGYMLEIELTRIADEVCGVRRREELRKTSGFFLGASIS